jgi:hypothetical protein
MSELHQRDACGGAVVAPNATTGVWLARIPTNKESLQVHRGFNGERRAAELEKAEAEHEKELAKIVDEAAKAKGKKP